MPTTATAFAETTRISKNPAELTKRVLALYRKFIRNVSIVDILNSYNVCNTNPLIRFFPRLQPSLKHMKYHTLPLLSERKLDKNLNVTALLQI